MPSSDQQTLCLEEITLFAVMFSAEGGVGEEMSGNDKEEISASWEESILVSVFPQSIFIKISWLVLGNPSLVRLELRSTSMLESELPSCMKWW